MPSWPWRPRLWTASPNQSGLSTPNTAFAACCWAVFCASRTLLESSRTHVSGAVSGARAIQECAGRPCGCLSHLPSAINQHLNRPCTSLWGDHLIMIGPSATGERIQDREVNAVSLRGRTLCRSHDGLRRPRTPRTHDGQGITRVQPSKPSLQEGLYEGRGNRRASRVELGAQAL